MSTSIPPMPIASPSLPLTANFMADPYARRPEGAIGEMPFENALACFVQEPIEDFSKTARGLSADSCARTMFCTLGANRHVARRAQ